MKKRILSLLLAGGMILTSLVIPTGRASTAEAAPGDSLVASYSLDNSLKDGKGGADATAVVTGLSNYRQDPGYEAGFIGDAVRLRDFGLKLNKTNLGKNFTVSMWVKPDGVFAENQVIAFLGYHNPEKWIAVSGNANNSSVCKFWRGNGTNTWHTFGTASINAGGWHQLTLTGEDSNVYAYLDGVLINSGNTATGGVGAPLEGVNQDIYIGVNNWDNEFAGLVDEVKVYDSALSEAEVQAVYNEDLVKSDAEKLTLPATASQDLALPASGNSGLTTVTWKSGNTDVITDDGDVKRPAQETKVAMTATITKGSATTTKTIEVTVPAANPNDDIQIYKDQLTLNAGYVSSDITLPATSGEADVTWETSDADVMTKYGVINRTDKNQEVTLTATLTLDGTASVTKEFKLVVLAEGASVVSYVSNDPALDADALKGQKGGMMLAAESEDGEGYDVLHKSQPIMYKKADSISANVAPYYVSPYIFRKADTADTAFGMIAAVNGKAVIYDSEDLITYTNEQEAELPGISDISKLYMVYDMTAEEYRLFVESSAGATYVLTSEDLTTFEAAEPTDFVIPTVENAPEYAIWASKTELTQTEYDKVTNKFTNPYNKDLEYTKPTEITVSKDATVEQIEAALDQAANGGDVNATYTGGYNGGTEKNYSIRWDADDLANIDTSRAGVEYSVTGIIGGSAYFTDAEDPLIEERADPCITYDEEREMYYFTASYPVNGKDGEDGYDRLVIREASTIEGLADAKEHVIWNEDNDNSAGNSYSQWIWAPELHKIGDSWYIISTAGTNGGDRFGTLRPFMMKCTDSSKITDASSWEAPKRVTAKSGDALCLNAMSLDMTYFQVGDSHYLAWADFTRNDDNPDGRSSIYIAAINPEDPTQLISDSAVISTPEYSWECVNIPVNEGPAVFINNGKVYMTFSAAATGAEYCVGLLTADVSDSTNLADPASWTKTPYPVMTSGDFNDELCGPGHNSFTTDKDGNLVIVYHARPAAEHATHSGDPLYDACRHAYVKPVFFDSEGAPILNLSDEEFAMGGSEFNVTVKVEGEYQDVEPVLEYNFDEELTDGKAKDSIGTNDAVLHGLPTYVQDADYGQVLYLDGDDGDGIGGHDSYLEFPQGFFDGKDELTVSFDVNEVSRSGNYFVFTIGQDLDKYIFLKIEPTAMRTSITTNRYLGEQTASYSSVYPNNSRTWMNIKLVITEDSLSIYRDGELIARQDVTISISDLGTDLKAYIGKSFYDGSENLPADKYFRGYFDNVKVYNYAMSEWEVARACTQEETARIEMLEDVQRVADTFEIPNMDNIKGNITLPSEKDGINISWKSSDDSVIASEDVNGKPAGVVTRQDKDTKVTLTAVFSKDGQESVTKTYDVTVKAKAPEVSEEDYVGYLFVHFTGHEGAASHEQTYFSISTDGLNWTDLNNNQAVLTSNIGESGLRDHFIARAPEGDKYYMIATDLSIYHNAGNWPNAGGSGSHGIVVWESDDLVNWSEPWIAEIAPENAGCTWAPEFIYDESTGEYVVYWSATSIELNDDGSIKQEYENHTIYYAKTRDFRTFTDAQVYHSGGVSDGKPVKIIDSTMIENEGTYYRYTKNEMNGTIMIDKSDSILGTFKDIPSQTLSTDLLKAQGVVEGPIIFKMNEKSADGETQWCLMVDRYGSGEGYYPLITTDLESGVFTMLNEGEFSMPSTYRHGYVMPVTAKEYDALQREYGADDYFSTYLLVSTIASAEAIDQSTLTDQSAADLRAAIAKAKEDLAAVEESKNMADVETAAAALQSVIDNLEYKEAVTLDSLDVTAPSKTTYTIGDKLDVTGLTAYAVYSNGVRKDVSAEVKLSGYDMDKVGTYTVTVTYTEGAVTVTDTFQIKVNPKDEPEPPTDPDEEAPDPSDRPGDPQNPNTSDPAEGAGENGGAVQTGDTTNIAPTAMACIFAFAAAAGIVVLKRRKRG